MAEWVAGVAAPEFWCVSLPFIVCRLTESGSELARTDFGAGSLAMGGRRMRVAARELHVARQREHEGVVTSSSYAPDQRTGLGAAVAR